MKVSIICPTNRTSNSAIANIIGLSQNHGPDIEIIISDNSGSKKKAELISSLKGPSCVYIQSESCGPFENFANAVARAKGDYTFIASDDDILFTHRLENLLSEISDSEKSGQQFGITGNFLITSGVKDQIVSYKDSFDNDDASARIINFANSMLNLPNLLYYSLHDTNNIKKSFEFLRNLPFKFSHSDQLQSIVFLAHSKFLYSESILYNYDLSEWNSYEKAVEKDASFYRSAGLSDKFALIHYLIQAVEGYFLISSDYLRQITNADLSFAAKHWFITKFKLQSSLSDKIYSEDSFTLNFHNLISNLRKRGEVNIRELVKEISKAFDEELPGAGQMFEKFWVSL